ncbi:Uncharacterised protein [Mycobacteroides abscessus subsp. abscessus]|nr:Uncharacterised protein [Mycobacteroides abscessus subsp. abscessus]
MENMIIDQDDLIEYIQNKVYLDKKIIEEVLDAESDFLKEKGILD